MIKNCKVCKKEFITKNNQKTCCEVCKRQNDYNNLKRWEENNLEKVKRHHKNWESNNPEKIKIHNENYKNWEQNNPEKYLLQKARSNAKYSKLEFNLELSDIIIPGVCPYLNMKLDKVGSKSRYLPSIDRIDPTKGYVKGNVQIISLKANIMKQDATKEELNTFAKSIIKMYG
jgi:hypothetical protein